jgi:hypothetical protein
LTENDKKRRTLDKAIPAPTGTFRPIEKGTLKPKHFSGVKGKLRVAARLLTIRFVYQVRK